MSTIKETLQSACTSDSVPSVDFNENQFDYQYQENIIKILEDGESRTDRTGVNTVSLFGDVSHKIDLRLGFPATTLKGFAFKTMKVETIDWMLKGKFDLKTLKDAGVRIWDQNVKPGTEVYEGKYLSVDERLAFLTDNQRAIFAAYRDDMLADDNISDSDFHIACENKLNNWGIPEQALSDGDLGPIYGKQWRDWGDTRVVTYAEWFAKKDVFEKQGFALVHQVTETVGVITKVAHMVIHRSIDQVADVEKAIAARSDSRRIILTGWNVAQLDEMSLPPCHTMAQWYVSQHKDENGLQYLDCKLYARSQDYLLGTPFNIAQYALITEMLAHTHGLRARFLYHTAGDAHLYQNHIDGGFVEEIVNRPIKHKSPKLHIDQRIRSTSILDIQVKDVTLVGYEGYEAQRNVPIAK